MSKGKLNIYRDNFLEKEELDRLMSFISDNPALFLFVSNAQSFGILQQGASLSIDPAFKVEVGTNSNTVKIITDSYALDKNGNMIYQRLFDNLPIAVDSLWYWMKISHRYDNYELGYIDIAVDGTISGSDTAFTEVLRGNSSGFPVKVKFFTQDDDGVLTPANNSGIYEVVSVASDNTAVIAGNLSVESHLRYVALGAFSIKTSVAAITSTGIFSYDSCNIEFILEEVSVTPPTTGFTQDEDFYIARISSNGVTVTVEDKRSNYYFRLNFGDIIVSNKANIDASNLDAPSILLWLAALNVYTKTQSDALVVGVLLAAQNLNDLANKTTARSNLGVYGTAYVDGVVAALQATDALKMVKTANLGDVANLATAQTNLVVYSKGAIDTALGLLMVKTANLSDVPVKATARTNLDVYSKAESDSGVSTVIGSRTYTEQNLITSNEAVGVSLNKLDMAVKLYTKVINLDDWNMNQSVDGSLTRVIAHGLTLSKIRIMNVTIRNDDATYHYNLLNISSSITADSTNIYLLANAIFDTDQFNAISYNRGWITIQYTK